MKEEVSSVSLEIQPKKSISKADFEFVTSMPLFRAISQKARLHLFYALEAMRVPAVTRFIRQGEEGDCFFIIRKGSCAVGEEVRGIHPVYVFRYRGKPLKRMNDKTWQETLKRVGLSHVRVHDLKHTFGRRLRAAGISFEDRRDLLGHKSGRITTHYSQAELENLVAATNKVCGEESRKTPALVILKKKRHLHMVAQYQIIAGA